MKKILTVRLIITIFILSIYPCLRINGQNTNVSEIAKSDTIETNPNEFQMLVLPPLELLYENAAKGPTVQLFDLKIKEQQMMLKKEKRAWTGFFSVGSGYNYGNVGVYSSYSDATTPLFSQYSGSTNSSWQVGASMSISIESLLDLVPRIKRQRLAIETAEMDRAQALDELRTKVVDMYIESKLQISLLKLQSQALVYANAKFKMVEQDFLNGQKDQADISNAKSDQSKAQEIYEQTKSSLMRSLLKLEIFTQTSIITKVLK